MSIPTRPFIKPAAGWHTFKPRSHTWARGPYRITQMWHPDRYRWLLRAYRGEVVTLEHFHLVGDYESFGEAVQGCVEDWNTWKQEKRA